MRDVELPNLTADVPDRSRETLAIIERAGTTSLPELAASSGYSKSTITRHVNRLAEEGAVETRMDGRTKNAEVTTTGRLLLGP